MKDPAKQHVQAMDKESARIARQVLLQVENTAALKKLLCWQKQQVDMCLPSALERISSIAGRKKGL